MLRAWHHIGHGLSGKKAKNLNSGHLIISTHAGVQNWTATRWKINDHRTENKLIALKRNKNKNS